MRWWPFERRDAPNPAADVSWDALAFQAGQFPYVGSPYLAENLSVVFTCVQAIASAIASLPAGVYRQDGTNRVEAPNDPLMRVISNGPNQAQSWPDFIEWLVAQVLLRGNGLAEILHDGRGAVTGFTAIPWSQVVPQILPSGRLAFDVTEITGIFGQTGQTKRLFADECLWIKDRTDNGLIGRSRLMRAGATVHNAQQVQHFANSMFENQATPQGMITGEGKIEPDSMKRLEHAIRERMAGPHNARKMLVLDQGLKFQAMSVSPEDAELLNSRRFSTEELARIFQVPPPLAGIFDHSTFTNSETAGRWFAQFTLTPWITKLEAEFSRSVFAGSGSFLSLDLAGLLRGDPLQRWQSYAIASTNRILKPNEIRQNEGWNPIEGGDDFPPFAADIQRLPNAAPVPPTEADAAATV